MLLFRHPIELVAKFQGFCSRCKRNINVGENYVKDGQSNYCSNCIAHKVIN